jgi:hypothetical protein
VSWLIVEQPKVKIKNKKIPNLRNNDFILLAPLLYLSPGAPFSPSPNTPSLMNIPFSQETLYGFLPII